MKKRGQASEALKYLIIAMIIIAVTFFGFTAVKKVSQKICDTGISKLKIQLANLDQTLKVGDSRELSFELPCGIDEIYFFDRDKEVDVSLLRNIPLLRESITSESRQNVFMVKNGKLLDTAYAGNLDITFPNYLCLFPKAHRIHFFLEGKAGKASIIPACTQPECTFLPTDQTNEDAAFILNEAKLHGQTTACPNCPRHVTTDFAHFIQTRENVEISRKYEYCKETGITNVEIKFTPKGDAELRNFVFYEYIPKECIHNIYDYLVTELDETKVNIRADPLIMWRIDELTDEQRISYAVEKFISDECKQTIDGVGVAQAIEDGVPLVSVPELPNTADDSRFGVGGSDNTAPELSIPNQQITGPEGKTALVIPQLSRFASDKDTNRRDLGYTITAQSNSEDVFCEIVKRQQVICTILKNDHSFSDVTIEAFDGQVGTKDTFRLRLVKFIKPQLCGDGTCDTSESCGTCPDDCGSCVDLYNTKYLKCGINVKDMCERDVECPARMEQFGPIGQCDCGLTCKKKYKCYEIDYTSTCSESSICPSGGTLIEAIPC